MNARTLRDEADQLKGRVVYTENRIENLENQAKEDEDLAKTAKEKVCYLFPFFYWKFIFIN